MSDPASLPVLVQTLNCVGHCSTGTRAIARRVLRTDSRAALAFLEEDAKCRSRAAHIMTDAALLERLNAAEYAAYPALPSPYALHPQVDGRIAGFASACARTTSSVSC